MSQPIPQPKGLPVVGNVMDIKPGNTWASLKTLAEKHGEIFKITVLGHTIVFIAGADLATEVCDEKRFRKYVGGPIVEIRYAVHDALFTAFDHESSWGIAHRIIAPKLSTASMALHFDQMRDTSLELMSKWRGLAAGKGEAKVTLVDELNRLNLEATTLTLFGKKLNGLDGPAHPMIQAMEDSTSEAVMRPTRPGLLNSLLYGSKFKKATAAMRSYAQELVDHRKANPIDGQEEDLLAAMMNRKDPETGTALKDSQVIDEIVSMPIGSSTAPCLLTSAIYHLLRTPDVLAAARAEVDSVLGGDDEGFTHEKLSRLTYIEATVREAMRLGHPAPGFNIEPIPSGTKEPVVIGGGRYQIPHDQPLILVLAGVNRDPAVFEDPLTFRPERMLNGGFESLPVGVTRWFGNGKRECIGKHYAWQWSVATLAMLLWKMDFEAADPAYELTMDGWFNVRPVDFEVKVKPRGD